jgi:hypothetical protein
LFIEIVPKDYTFVHNHCIYRVLVGFWVI